MFLLCLLLLCFCPPLPPTLPWTILLCASIYQSLHAHQPQFINSWCHTQMCLATDLCLLLVAWLGSSCDFHRTLQSSWMDYCTFKCKRWCGAPGHGTCLCKSQELAHKNVEPLQVSLTVFILCKGTLKRQCHEDKIGEAILNFRMLLCEHSFHGDESNKA